MAYVCKPVFYQLRVESWTGSDVSLITSSIGGTFYSDYSTFVSVPQYPANPEAIGRFCIGSPGITSIGIASLFMELYNMSDALLATVPLTEIGGYSSPSFTNHGAFYLNIPGEFIKKIRFKIVAADAFTFAGSSAPLLSRSCAPVANKIVGWNTLRTKSIPVAISASFSGKGNKSITGPMIVLANPVFIPPVGRALVIPPVSVLVDGPAYAYARTDLYIQLFGKTDPTAGGEITFGTLEILDVYTAAPSSFSTYFSQLASPGVSISSTGQWLTKFRYSAVVTASDNCNWTISTNGSDIIVFGQ